MKDGPKSVLLNSTVAFVLAAMLATTIHEGAHLSMALLLGEKAIIFPNLVGMPDHVSNLHAGMVAAAGPLFSLVSGLLIIWLASKASQGFMRLLVLWFGFLSAETGFGYFLVAPFVSGGDTGQVLSLLHAPGFVYALSFIVGGLGAWVLLPRLLAARLSVFTHDKADFFRLGMYPWLIGTAILLIIYAISTQVLLARHVVDIDPSMRIFILVGIATIGIFTPIADFNTKKAETDPQALALGAPIVGVIVSAVVALVLILGLTHGIAFNA